MVLTICAYCKKKISVKPKRLEKYEHCFCNREHYHLWRKEHPSIPKKKPDMTIQKKLKKAAENRKKSKQREVI